MFCPSVFLKKFFFFTRCHFGGSLFSFFCVWNWVTCPFVILPPPPQFIWVTPRSSPSACYRGWVCNVIPTHLGDPAPLNPSWTMPACSSLHCWTTPASWNTLRKWVVLLNAPWRWYFSPNLFQLFCVCRLYIRLLSFFNFFFKKTVAMETNQLPSLKEGLRLHQPNHKILVLVLCKDPVLKEFKSACYCGWLLFTLSWWTISSPPPPPPPSSVNCTQPNNHFWCSFLTFF